MSTFLCPLLTSAFANPSKREIFFSEEEDRSSLGPAERREQPILGRPGYSCKTNLFFGFFFDGTKNNYLDAEIGRNHSNVARLYDCYPGLSVRGVLPSTMDWKYDPARYSHFFKAYVPGVATRFDLVGDDGTDIKGGASGKGGEARIVWGLLQAINNIHRYLLKTALIGADEALRLSKGITLTKDSRRLMKRKTFSQAMRPKSAADIQTRKEFEKVLQRLHSAIARHMPDKKGKTEKIDPAVVKTIYVSTFGFSRGATQARAFTNWLMSLCELDSELCGSASERTLGGFPVQFDFLGLIDTVASIGLGNTFGNTPGLSLFDGHGAWADTEESLRIPPGLRCVHLVAAHELRRSFPVDSVSVRNVLPDNCDEVVVPGVHSDLGCGYAPGEQGRGIDPTGADMLARVPLVYMYKMARLGGVPLKLEFASEVAKERFRIQPKTIQAVNAYLADCVQKTGTITAIMREQARKQIEWRVARRASGTTPLHISESFRRATNFDKNDLYSASLEFDSEIKDFETWIAGEGKRFRPESQPPGFDNDYEDEWQEIATWWSRSVRPSAAVMDMFDNYVHDSHAWFKLIPGHPDNEKDAHKQLQGWVEKRKKVKAYNERHEKLFLDNQAMAARLYGRQRNVVAMPYRPMVDGLTASQRNAADEYDKMEAGKKTIPRMITEGRETYGLANKAGYLRFRKIYGGWDSVLLSSAPEVTPGSPEDGRESALA